MGSRAGSCGCGGATITAQGEPLDVYACSCIECQRKTGGAFAYNALFPRDAVALAGKTQGWRRPSESGRWVESRFCPTCGTTLCFHGEGFPQRVVIPVGVFTDANFAAPKRLYWSSRRHHWLDMPPTIESVERQ